jgi:DNA-binding NtrC family response regulator
MKKALIVDPHPDIRQLLDLIVRKHGYEGLVTSNFREARRAIETAEFDLVVCDCEKEEDECEYMIALIHRRRADVPIIIFTERGSHSLAPEFRDDYCFILKKFSFRRVQTILEDGFERVPKGQD